MENSYDHRNENQQDAASTDSSSNKEASGRKLVDVPAMKETS